MHITSLSVFIALLAQTLCPLRAAETQRTFTDALGRSHSLPENITQVYTTSPMGTIYVYTLAPDTLVGLNSHPTKGERRYLLPETLKLPVLGGWFGKNGTGNVETLMAAHPQVIISVSDRTDTNRDFADKLQKQTGIPVLVLDNSLEHSADAYAMLGEILGRQEQAALLAQYCTKTFENIRSLVSAIPENERVRFYYAEGIKGLETDHILSWHTESFRIAGGRNVCLSGEDSGFGRARISMEQVLLWQPEYMFIGRDKGEDTDRPPAWLNNPQWHSIPAYKNDRIYVIPDAPFNWMDRPPSVNRIIGIRWAFWSMYPNRVNFDMIEETRTFFKLFYHYDMGEDEARTLLHRSQLRTNNE